MLQSPLTHEEQLIIKFSNTLTRLRDEIVALQCQNLQLDGLSILDIQLQTVERPIFSLDKNPLPFFIKKIRGTDLKIHFRPSKKREKLSREEQESYQNFKQHYQEVEEAFQNFINFTDELLGEDRSLLVVFLMNEQVRSNFYFIIANTIAHNDLWLLAENILEKWLPLLRIALTGMEQQEELIILDYLQYRLALLVQQVNKAPLDTLMNYKGPVLFVEKSNKKPTKALVINHKAYLQNPLINAYEAFMALHKNKPNLKPHAWQFKTKFAFFEQPPLRFPELSAGLDQLIRFEFACLAYLLVDFPAGNNLEVFELLNTMAEKNYISRNISTAPITSPAHFVRALIYLEDAINQHLMLFMFFHSESFLLNKCFPQFESMIIYGLQPLINTQAYPSGYLYYAAFTALNVLKRLEGRKESFAKVQSLVRNTLSIFKVLQIVPSIADYCEANPYVNELLAAPVLEGSDLEKKIQQLRKDLSALLSPKEVLFEPDVWNKDMEDHLKQCFKTLAFEEKQSQATMPLLLPAKFQQKFQDREVIDQGLYNFYYALYDFYYMSTGLGYDSLQAPKGRGLSLEKKKTSRHALSFSFIITRALSFLVGKASLRKHLFCGPLGKEPVYYFLRSTLLMEYPVSVQMFYKQVFGEKKFVDLSQTPYYQGLNILNDDNIVPLSSQVAPLFQGAGLSDLDRKLLIFLEIQWKIQSLVQERLDLIDCIKFTQKKAFIKPDPKKYNYLVEAYIIFNELYEPELEDLETWNQDKWEKMEVLAEKYPLGNEIPEIFLCVLRILFVGDMLPKYLHLKRDKFKKLSEIINKLSLAGYFPKCMQIAVPSADGLIISIARLLDHVQAFKIANYVTNKKFDHIIDFLKALKLVFFNKSPLKLSAFVFDKADFMQESIEILKANKYPEDVQGIQDFFEGFQKIVAQSTRDAPIIAALCLELPAVLKSFIHNGFLKEAGQLLSHLIKSTHTAPRFKDKYRPILRIIAFLTLEISEEKPLDDAIHELIDAVGRTTKNVLEAIDLNQALSLRLLRKIKDFKDKYQILQHKTKIQAFTSFSKSVMTLAGLLNTKENDLKALKEDLLFIKTALLSEEKPASTQNNKKPGLFETEAAVPPALGPVKSLGLSIKAGESGLFSSHSKKHKKKNKAASHPPSDTPKPSEEKPALLATDLKPQSIAKRVAKKGPAPVTHSVSLPASEAGLPSPKETKLKSPILFESKATMDGQKPRDATHDFLASLGPLQREPLNEERIKFPIRSLIYGLLDSTGETLVLYRFSATNLYLNYKNDLPLEFILFTNNLEALYTDMSSKQKTAGPWKGISEIRFEQKPRQGATLDFKLQFNEEKFVIKIREGKKMANESIEEAMFKIIIQQSSNLNALFVPFTLDKLNKEKRWKGLEIIGLKDCFGALKKSTISVVDHKCLLTRTLAAPQSLSFSELDQLFLKNHGFVLDAHNRLSYVDYQGEIYQITQINVLNPRYLENVFPPEGKVVHASFQQLKNIRLAGGHEVPYAMLIRFSESPSVMHLGQIVALFRQGPAYVLFEETLYYGYFDSTACAYEFDIFAVSNPYILDEIFPKAFDSPLPATQEQLRTLTYLSGPGIAIPAGLFKQNLLQVLDDLVIMLLHYEAFEFDDMLAKLLNTLPWKANLQTFLENLDNRKSFAKAIKSWFEACAPSQVQDKLIPLLGKLGIVEGMTGLNYAYIQRTFSSLLPFAAEDSASQKIAFDSCMLINYCMQNPSAKKRQITQWPYYHCMGGPQVGQILFALLQIGFLKGELDAKWKGLITSIRDHYADAFQQKIAQWQWQQQNIAYNFECLRAKVYQKQRYAMFQPVPDSSEQPSLEAVGRPQFGLLYPT